MIYQFAKDTWLGLTSYKYNNFIYHNGLRYITAIIIIALPAIIIIALILTAINTSLYYTIKNNKIMRTRCTAAIISVITAVTLTTLIDLFIPVQSYLPDDTVHYGVPGSIYSANSVKLNMHNPNTSNPFKPVSHCLGTITYKNKPIAKNYWNTYKTTKLVPVNNTGKALLNVAKYNHNKHADYLDIIHINNAQVKLHRVYNKNAAGFKEITVTAKINQPNTLHITKQTHSYTTVAKTVHETKTVNE